MNILAFSQSADIIGGANRSFLDVLISLTNEYHHDCLVVVPGSGEFSKALETNRISYITFPYEQTSYVELHDFFDFYRTLRTTLKVLKNWCNLRKFKKNISENKIDVIYINDTTNTFGYLVAKSMGIPFVWHFRGYQAAIKRYLPFENSLRTNPKGLFVNISNAMKDYMVNVRKLKDSSCIIIYNGVKNKCPIDKKENLRTNANADLHCLHCGHISEAKGVMDSLYAMVELKRRGYSNIYLHYAGTSSIAHGKLYKNLLNKVIEENNLSNNIVFEGEVKDMLALRRNMDVELMCSKAEPFGRTTIEGMQSGLAVIGANTGATPEIIKDGSTGLLYMQGNPIDLADKICLLYNTPTLIARLSNSGLIYTKDHFTMKANVDSINRVLLDVVKNTKI